MLYSIGMLVLTSLLTTFYETNKTDTNNNSNLKMMNAESTNQVYELALYTIKDVAKENFPELSKKTNNYLSTFRGYLSSETYHSISDQTLYLDIVLWESLDHALEAQKKFESDERVAGHMQAIDTIKFLGHAKTISAQGVLKFNDLNENDVLEFATIYLTENSFAEFLKSRQPLMNHISKQYPEFKQVNTLQSVKNPNLLIDIAWWGNVEACSLAQEQIESHELFMNFASSFDMEKEMIMEFFTKLK